MRAVDAQRIETMAGSCAAASLAAAVGFAVFHAVGLVAGLAGMVAAGGLSALAAYPAGTSAAFACWKALPSRFLNRYSKSPDIEPVDRRRSSSTNWLLTRGPGRIGSDRATTACGDGRRWCSTICCAEIAPDSRVVQLFDRVGDADARRSSRSGSTATCDRGDLPFPVPRRLRRRCSRRWPTCAARFASRRRSSALRS